MLLQEVNQLPKMAGFYVDALPPTLRSIVQQLPEEDSNGSSPDIGQALGKPGGSISCF